MIPCDSHHEIRWFFVTKDGSAWIETTHVEIAAHVGNDPSWLLIDKGCYPERILNSSGTRKR